MLAGPTDWPGNTTAAWALSAFCDCWAGQTSGLTFSEQPHVPAPAGAAAGAGLGAVPPPQPQPQPHGFVGAGGGLPPPHPQPHAGPRCPSTDGRTRYWQMAAMALFREELILQLGFRISAFFRHWDFGIRRVARPDQREGRGAILGQAGAPWMMVCGASPLMMVTVNVTPDPQQVQPALFWFTANSTSDRK